MLKISFRSQKDTEEKLVKNEKLIENENDDENEGRFLMAQYFLFNTIEFVNTSFVNNKPNENVTAFTSTCFFLIQIENNIFSNTF